jgi:hypothetical protein
MKPLPILLAALALALGLSLTYRSPPGQAYKDSLDTNEFPSRFTVPILPRAAAQNLQFSNVVPTIGSQPVHVPPAPETQSGTPPKPRVPSQFTEAWQAAALNDGLSLVLTQQLQMYSTQAIRGKIYYDPNQYPSNFIPQVPSFEFVRSLPPHHGANFNGPDFLMHLTGWIPVSAGSTNPFWSHFGEPIAHFSISPRGVHGGVTVGLDVSFGVFKGSNGLKTQVMMAIDP